MDMRGLSKVISEIRKASAQSKEEEQKVIEKELHKVRQKFKETKNMRGYDRKKNVCKLLYIFMLGYEVDFGQMEAVQLLSSDKYSEKHIGYLACTLFLNENDELLTLITHSIKQDLNGGKGGTTGPLTWEKECAQCLALTALANVGGKDFADSMVDDVRRIALSKSSSRDGTPVVKKKALLTLLRLYRSSPERLEVEEAAPAIIEELSKGNLSIVNSALSLILGLVGRHSAQFSAAVPKIIKLLYRLILSKEVSHEYIYYTVPAPWIQVKCFRILQHFDMPAEGSLITSVLNKIILTSERVLREHSHQKQRGTPARNNAMNAVLAEAINLVLHWDKDKELLNMSAGILVRFITDAKDANLRYIGLDLMAKLSYSPEVFHTHIQKNQQATIVSSLRDPDISIRRKALDLLYVMCDKTNAGEIVGEMLEYLPSAEFAIKEELVVKIAILCERYAADYSWYIDVIMNIVSQAGDFVSPDVWQRVVHIVTNHLDVQKHAVTTVFRAVTPPSAHEVAVKVACHLLGEFGSLLPDTPETNAMAQFNALHGKWGLVSSRTKALLLSCYAKFYTQYPNNNALRDRIRKVLETNAAHMDVELQQRAVEYLNMINPEIVEEVTLQKVFENMPAFEVDFGRAHQKVMTKGGDTTDQNIWQQKQAEKERELQESKKRETEQHEQMRGQAFENWKSEAYATVFACSTSDEALQNLIRSGVNQRFLSNHAGVWNGSVDVNQPFGAFLSSITEMAKKEAAQGTPKLHHDSVFLKIGEGAVNMWREQLIQQTQQQYSETNKLGLAGCTADIVESALAEIEEQAVKKKESLQNMFPNWNKETGLELTSALDDIFGGPVASTAPPPQPAAASVPATSSGLDDIFGAPVSAASTPAPVPPAAAAPVAATAPQVAAAPPLSGGLDDIFGPSATPAAPANVSASPSPFSGPPPLQQQSQQLPEVSDAAAQHKMTTQNLPLLLTAAQGVLYEDERVQVAVRSQYQGPEGQIGLFVGNKTQGNFTQASAAVSCPAGVRIRHDPLPAQIFAGNQLQHMLHVTCEGVFSGYPTISLQFVVNNQQFSLQAPLPITPTKFMEPLNLTGQQFFQAWQATQSAQSPQKIYRSPRDIDLAGCQAMLSETLKMNVLRAVDENQNNMVGAGYFTPQPWTTAPPPKQQFVVLVNVETNPGAKAARVTIKSPIPEIEVAVHEVIQRYFE